MALRPVRVLIARRNVLIGGIAGAGKSGILNVIIAALAACRDVVLWGVDLKGGMELQPWAACFDRLATTPDEAAELFRDAVAFLLLLLVLFLRPQGLVGGQK